MLCVIIQSIPGGPVDMVTYMEYTHLNDIFIISQTLNAFSPQLLFLALVDMISQVLFNRFL